MNTLRLWSARPADPLRLDAFNLGDHAGALSEQIRAEAISKVLYPSDEIAGGPGAAAAPGILLHLRLAAGPGAPPRAGRPTPSAPCADKVAIQLNDTHPAIGIAEMMRILVDLHDVPWDEAWEMTQATFCYTNHTLLPEALESWPVGADGAAAAAPHADHLPDQRAAPRRARASCAPTTTGCWPGCR